MPRIYYTAENYRGGYMSINTSSENFVLCRKLDLYRAIITVGNPKFIGFSLKDIKKFGLFRVIYSNIIDKMMLIYSNIESDPTGIYLHSIYDTYVSDQKRIVSYNLGMAVAKLYSEKLLKIPHLMHVESLKKNNVIVLKPGPISPKTGKPKRPKEPDLLGLTSNGDWHVFESKGTSKISLDSKLKEAKTQAEQILSINSKTPSTLTACATSFTKKRIFTKLNDPQSDGNKEYEINLENFYDTYYQSFFALYEYSGGELVLKTIENIEYNCFILRLPQLNLEMGLDFKIYKFLESSNYIGLSKHFAEKRHVVYDSVKNDRPSIGLDGILVKYVNY
jgi:hypothetical protein